jgi:putative membrane protein
MVADHGKANDELKRIVASKNATLPSDLEPAKSGTIEELQGTTGSEFDRRYMKQMVKDQKKDVREFEKAAKAVTDADLRAFAEKTLPTLREHLQMAERAETNVKGER